MIYIDNKGHMISDVSLEELHIFAILIGLKREWFQEHGRYPHYDLTTERMRNKAAKYNDKCIVIGQKELLTKLKATEYYKNWHINRE